MRLSYCPSSTPKENETYLFKVENENKTRMRSGDFLEDGIEWRNNGVRKHPSHSAELCVRYYTLKNGHGFFRRCYTLAYPKDNAFALIHYSGDHRCIRGHKIDRKQVHRSVFPRMIPKRKKKFVRPGKKFCSFNGNSVHKKNNANVKKSRVWRFLQDKSFRLEECIKSLNLRYEDLIDLPHEEPDSYLGVLCKKTGLRNTHKCREMLHKWLVEQDKNFLRSQRKNVKEEIQEVIIDFTGEFRQFFCQIAKGCFLICDAVGPLQNKLILFYFYQMFLVVIGICVIICAFMFHEKYNILNCCIMVQ